MKVKYFVKRGKTATLNEFKVLLKKNLNHKILLFFLCIKNSMLHHKFIYYLKVTYVTFIGKGYNFSKEFDVEVQVILYLNFDVKRFEKYSISYRTSHFFTQDLFRLYYKHLLEKNHFITVK